MERGPQVRRATVRELAQGSNCPQFRDRPGNLLIASTAAANGLPLYTRNPSDLVALKRILKVIGI